MAKIRLAHTPPIFSIIVFDRTSIAITLLTTFSFTIINKFVTNSFSLITFLFFSIILCVSAFSWVRFYIFFELTLIPISLIIIKRGYQPERLHAFMFIVIYMLLFALPLILTITFIISYNIQSFPTNKLIPHEVSSVLVIILIPFLVKLPTFPLHVWLPRAHVEAPVYGSIVLAALLLKLSPVGLIRLFSRLSLNVVSGYLLSTLIVFGATLAGFWTISLSDIKALIAYSSVCHIATCTAPLFLYSPNSLISRILGIVAHGFVSRTLFALAFSLYSIRNTRNLITLKAIAFSRFFLFLITAINVSLNFGLPPSLNFHVEIIRVILLVHTSYVFLIFICPLIVIVGVYRRFLLTASHFNNNRFSYFTRAPLPLLLPSLYNTMPVFLILSLNKIIYP